MSAALGRTGTHEAPQHQEHPQDLDQSSSSSEFDVKTPQEQGQIHDEAVHALARKFTEQSHHSHHESPFQAPEGSSLDPSSPNFKAKDWARAFFNARSSTNAPPRQAGVAFKNLNVWGVGSPTDFQTSVGNSILKLPSLFGRGTQKIDILRDLEGLVLPGEVRLTEMSLEYLLTGYFFQQCCVLAPPGSGSSTLLKTIAGETHGFQVSPDSYTNYQGIPREQMHSKFRGEVTYTAEVDVHYPQLPVWTTLYFAA